MATNRVFDKKATGHKELLALLTQRGLIINDEKFGYWVLEKIGFYRLSGFCLPYQNKKLQFNKHNFAKGTTLEEVLALYNFDTGLREIITNALGMLEVALRTSICEKMCSFHDSHWYTNVSSYATGKFQAIFDDAAKCVDFDTKNNRPFQRDPEEDKRYARQLFLDHYYCKYTKPPLPPAWMLRETASFSFWAKMFDALNTSDRRRITQSWLYFDGKQIDDVLFASWLRSLTILRNRCSHQTRVTNRSFPFEPALPRNNPSKLLFESKTDDLRTLFAIILVLTKTSLPDYDWRGKILKLFNEYAQVDIEKATGFSKEGKLDWSQTKFWTIN